MDEHEINAYLRGNKVTRKHFLGILAYDELPIIQSNGFYIVNSGHSSTLGQHWMVILRLKGKIEFFDSLARAPEYYSPLIESYLFRNALNYEMSVKRIQGRSNFCANYCMLYCYLRIKKYSMLEFLDMFDSDLEMNDKLVNLN